MGNLQSQVILDDCLSAMKHIGSSTIDLVYLDPPFFTNRFHFSVSRDRKKRFSFADVWSGLEDYAEFMEFRITEIHRVLKDTGSVFIHCDTSANFLLRALLNSVFEGNQFRSEIIWSYRRWSNSARGLLPSHQTILFYSKTDQYKFNILYGAYSETTNIDQILQLRTRDKQGISAYATDHEGKVIFAHEKKGVPLSDVWEIPFLNPKAKERTGYPTQKPVLLLERIIEISTNMGDLVLDPFCGSGTTLVAANLLGRHSIGIDISQEAVELTRNRLGSPTKTDSALLKKGRVSYQNVDKEALSILSGLDLLPVQRNAGIDAFIKIPIDNSLVPIRVQRNTETVMEAASKLARAANSKNSTKAILVRTKKNDDLFFNEKLPTLIELIDSTALCVREKIEELQAKSVSEKVSNRMLMGYNDQFCSPKVEF